MRKSLNATVMVIDGGGRGSVLVEKYARSNQVKRVFAIPGNDLMQNLTDKPVKTFPYLKTTDISKISEIAKKEKADLIDVAQDDAVAAGLVNHLIDAGFKVIGPTKEAGQIEWDKAWARKFMKRNKLPIPKFKICINEKEGFEFIKNNKERKWYVKASGLAAGKGALFAENNEDTMKRIEEMNSFGLAGKTFLIEECLQGEEFSSYALVSGTSYAVIGHAQDHKTIFDGDLGPNTGGMGCTSTPLVITKKIEKQINVIFKKTIEGLFKEQRPYFGILYLGGIIDNNGQVKIIEFNARWGDPEAQVLVPAIKNDLFVISRSVIEGKLKQIQVENNYRIVIAATARGYPDDYLNAKNKRIFGLESLIKRNDIALYGAGVRKNGNKYFTSGGRLFYIFARGRNIVEARRKAYSALSSCHIEGNNLHFRTDIGHRDLGRFYQ